MIQMTHNNTERTGGPLEGSYEDLREKYHLVVQEGRVALSDVASLERVVAVKERQIEILLDSLSDTTEDASERIAQLETENRALAEEVGRLRALYGDTSFDDAVASCMGGGCQDE